MAEENQPQRESVAKGPPPAQPTDDRIAPGLPLPAHAVPHAEPRIDLPPPSELARFVRWVLGATLVAAAGWALVFFGYWVTGSPNLGPAVAAVISLGLFLLLERNFWLSRFMCLRVTPTSSPILSALYFWLLGIPGLLLRSTVPATTDVPATMPEQARQPPERPPTTSTQQHADGTREVVETIVFVVVLVLLLKTFLAEAFVIPTGSMATTLWGYHKNVVCDQCQYPFQVNASDEVERKPPEMVVEWTCPNCRFQNRSRLLEGFDP